jgi:excisionase family DNA binding protein
MNFEHPAEWITAKEAADLKGVHRNNIAKAIREGRLKGVMVGGRYLMRHSDVEQWEPVGHRPKKDEPSAAAIRRLLVTYLDSEETDAIARRHLERLPGGTEALARAQAIKAAFAPLAGTGVSVDEYLQGKREERETERRRDEERDAQHA